MRSNTPAMNMRDNAMQPCNAQEGGREREGSGGDGEEEESEVTAGTGTARGKGDSAR